ncbi:MAG: carbon-nitrogen hydrolase family protein [Gammaproteobacteria bacterium]|nr:carbon-nitrogen hydrolase family protein [Gammaproteobacteria bacterium]
MSSNNKPAESLTLAIAQLEPNPANVSGCVSEIEKLLTRAAKAGADLLVVPEMYTMGYELNLPVLQQLAEPADGPLASRLGQLCQTHGIGIAYGFGEQVGDAVFNSVQLLDAAGVSKAVYRKTHLWGDLDRNLFCPGENLVEPVRIGDWSIGLLICYDIEFPEAARWLAMRGADLILVPTGLMTPWRDVAEKVVPVRAYENQLYLAYTNYCGREVTQHYEGRSCIVGPDGIDRVRADQSPELLITTLDKTHINEARRALPYHRDRRPELYAR